MRAVLTDILPVWLKMAAIVAVALVMHSCEHKDLCFDHEDHMPRYATDLELEYDIWWEKPIDLSSNWQLDWPDFLELDYNSLLPGLPEGVRVHTYGENGLCVRTNLPAEGGTVHMQPGENSILVYNNDTEYILFNDMESYSRANVTTRTRQRSSYSGNPLYTPPARGPKRQEEILVNMPDMLYGNYRDSYMQERITVAPTLRLTMHPLVYKYVVCYRFSRGLEHVVLARGTISGLAESVSLHDGRTSASAVTVLFDCTLEGWGAQAEVRTFGIPDYPNPDYSRAEGNFAINLEVRLRNGKILNFYRDITDQLMAQPRGGVIILDGFEISDADASQGGEGVFEVDVDGWGEYQDIDVEFNF